MVVKHGISLMLSLTVFAASCGGKPPAKVLGKGKDYSTSGNSNNAGGGKSTEPSTGSTGPLSNGTAAEFFPNSEKELAKKRIFRLTQVQFDETIKFALPAYTAPSLSTLIAVDPKQNNYDYSDFLTINAANYTPYTQWVSAIASAVEKEPTKLINCALVPPAVDCHKTAATKFVNLAFRGAIDAATMALYVDFFVASFNKSNLATASSELVSNVLMSPEFTFRAEFSTDKDNKLLPGELRQSLAYTLADAPLADLLGSGVDKADAGDLVEKAMASAQAKQKLKRFFMDWLEIKKPAEFRISKEEYPLFTEAMATEALSETSKYLDYYLAQPNPKLTDLVNSRKTFVSSTLKSIYASDTGKGEEATHDPEKRLGLFTQSAFIASRSGPIEANVIKRGVFFMRKVMCLETGAVPKGTETKIPEGGARTERERVEAGTQVAPCVACHAKINPFGFAFENFDAIGRWRTMDNNLPVNANVSMAFLGDTMTSTNNPVDALEYFTKTDRFKQCFVRQVFRYYMGRNELVSDDPLLKDMYQHLTEKDEDILGLLKTMVNSTRFNTRN